MKRIILIFLFFVSCIGDEKTDDFPNIKRVCVPDKTTGEEVCTTIENKHERSYN